MENNFIQRLCALFRGKTITTSESWEKSSFSKNNYLNSQNQIPWEGKKKFTGLSHPSKRLMFEKASGKIQINVNEIRKLQTFPLFRHEKLSFFTEKAV